MKKKPRDEDEEESPERGEGGDKGYPCPSCKKPQPYFEYHRSKYGWVRCPGCGTYVRKKEVPDRFIKAVRKTSGKPMEGFEGEGVEEAEEIDESEAGGVVPFRRPRPAHVILSQILDEFGVKQAAKRIMVTRCRRVGELHPTDVQRMLMDLDSGLNPKEAGYVADEYYYAVQNERRAAAEAAERPGTYMWGGGEKDQYGGYGRYGGEYSRPAPLSPYSYPSGYGSGYGDSQRRQAWGQQGVLTEDRLMQILEERDRQFQDAMRRQRVEDSLSELMKQVIDLANEVKQLKENPPTAVPPDVVTRAELEKERSDAYMKMLERQVAALEKAVERYESALKEAEDRHEKILDKVEAKHREEVKELRDKLEDTMRSSRAVEGYKDDSVRLAAEALNRAADILEKKEPVRAVSESLARLAEGEPEKPPQFPKEKVGEETITEQIPEEYLE